MGVQRNTRERVFSILNDNDCPSFVIRQNTPSLSLPPQKLPSISSFTSLSPRLERPNLLRHPQFSRTTSISSAGSPPLFRHDSSSSTSSKSSNSMDSTPSPITPAYNYNDNSLVPYENLNLNPATMPYLPSPSGITPFMEQGMMLGPVDQGGYHHKAAPVLAPAVYPILPAAGDMVQMPTPTLSANASISSTTSTVPLATTSPGSTTGNINTGKKNKYPCPYAASHHCTATFTTSGHAARHGKKHTGEKGVHCPICDKAFTRKDNMKQHERTHKNQPVNGDEKKSKAQTTREANKTKDVEQEESSPQPDQSVQSIQPTQHSPAQTRETCSLQSEPSDITLAPNPVDTPADISPVYFGDANPQIILPADSSLNTDAFAATMYPPLVEDAMLSGASLPVTEEKLNVRFPQPPSLVRGFSDLDTLAQAAESAFDPYFQQGQF